MIRVITLVPVTVVSERVKGAWVRAYPEPSTRGVVLDNGSRYGTVYRKVHITNHLGRETGIKHDSGRARGAEASLQVGTKTIAIVIQIMGPTLACGSAGKV